VTKREHIQKVIAGDHRPRVVQHGEYYVAWTPTREGPARPDYAAARADLRNMIEKRKIKWI